MVQKKLRNYAFAISGIHKNPGVYEMEYGNK